MKLRMSLILRLQHLSGSSRSTSLLFMANPAVLSALGQNDLVRCVNDVKDDVNQNTELPWDRDVPPPSNPCLPANIPEPARKFFASVSSPTDILSSELVSRVEGIDVIEGGYNHVHILNLDTGESDPPFSFVLRFPIDPDTISRSQTRTSVGCMLFCQRRPDLNISTPAIYAHSCTYGSEFIAMEYIDGDILSDVWLDLPEEEKESMTNQVAEIMRTMRTKTAFNMIGGISPDGSACPLVDGVNVANGRVSLMDCRIPQKLNIVQGVADRLALYNIGPLVLRRPTLFIYDACSHSTQVRIYTGICSVCLRPSIPLHGSNVAQGHALGSRTRVQR